MRKEFFTVSLASFWFALLLTAHTTLLLIADLSGAKLIEIPYFNLTASIGFITYGFSVVVLLVIRELFGSQFAKKTVVIGFFFLIVCTVFITIALSVQPASFWPHEEAYELTLGRVWRMVTFGYLSYFIAQYLEVITFNFLNRFENMYKPIRGFISASSTQLVETSIFMTTVFWGVVPSMPKLIGGQFLLKLALLCISIPAAYFFAGRLQRYLSSKAV